MISRCKQLDLDDATPGMVLSEPITDAHGGMLLPASATLTDSALTALRRRGIASIVVINADITEEELNAERECVQQRLARLFRRSDTGSAPAALLARITDYRLGGVE